MTSKVEYKGGLRTNCTHLSSKAKLATDAPTDNHGQGALFSPTDLIATALASCMLTVMGIRAEKEGISFQKINADVLKKMTSGPRLISEIVIELDITENWSPEDKEIMEYTAINCPVALSLHPDLKQKVVFNYNT